MIVFEVNFQHFSDGASVFSPKSWTVMQLGNIDVLLIIDNYFNNRYNNLLLKKSILEILVIIDTDNVHWNKCTVWCKLKVESRVYLH